MIEFLQGVLAAVSVFIFIPWLVGYYLRKSNNSWYERLCRERYLKMVAEKAIKKVLDDDKNKGA